LDIALLEHLKGFLTEERKERFDKILSERTKHFTVVAEDVYQIHNTSAVMRSCDAFGIQDLHLVEERIGKSVDKEIAMGSQKWVSLHRHNNMNTCMETLKAQGYQIVATSPHADASYLHDFDFTKKSALFFGTEKDGLTESVLEQADALIKIPMHGFTESLNISVSAAIIMQYLVTKMKLSDLDWQLSEEEKLELELQWAKNTIKSYKKIIDRFYETRTP
jgi:tRNA (guanosine-2'-O-)-methyltransferase